MIKFLLPHLLWRLVSSVFEKKRKRKEILAMRKEIASIRADVSMSDENRTALIMNLLKRIHILEAEVGDE